MNPRVKLKPGDGIGIFSPSAPVTHTHPMMTLPIGSIVELDSTRQTLRILEDWTR